MARWLREATQQLLADRTRRLRNTTSVDSGETSESSDSEGNIPHGVSRRLREFEEYMSADERRAWGIDMMQDPPPENAEATFAPTEELQFSEDRCFCHHRHFLRCENRAVRGDFWCKFCKPRTCLCECTTCETLDPETECWTEQLWQGQPDQATVPPMDSLFRMYLMELVAQEISNAPDAHAPI